MNAHAVLAAAAAHWERLADTLEGPLRARLAGPLRVVREGRDEATRDSAVAAAAGILQECLPDEFGAGRRGPSAAGVLDDPYLEDAYPGFRAEDLAVLLLDGHQMVGPVLGAVRERLLAEPAVSADALRDRGGDPHAADLIRLRGAGGAVLLPSFQFSADDLPWLTVLEVNRILEAGRDPWGAADWWLSANAWLGCRPAELLGTERERNLAGTAGHLMEGD
ncbi:hypothetical protein ACIBG6_16555 [Streptomyces sp. NPDC050842]|uniref:hypothetical protein n=1 Tax=Streptomyces sp. NPDC050842 TaxID=3365636 RepID=UPI00378DDD41